MSDNNLPAPAAGPVDDAPKTFDEGVAGIADLLTDPETDLLGDSEEQASAAPEDAGDDPDIDVTEDVDADEGADDQDGPQDGPQDADIKGGRFAPDNAKITLPDGQVITVADAKRSFFWQRDYTEKTTALKADREQVDARRSEVDQQAQSLTQLAEYLDWYGQQFLPTPPEPFQGSIDTDPIGYMRHGEAVKEYERAMGLRAQFQSQREQLQAQQSYEERQKGQQAFAAELSALTESDPKFWGDTGKMQSFLGELLSKGNEWWGLTKDDLGTLRTRKQWEIVRDAMRYRKALAKAPDVQKQVQAKPVMQSGGRRFDPKAKVSADRQARSERLRTTGSMDDAVELLKSLNL